MNIVKPSVDIITPINDGIEILKTLELAGRTCYKSEDKISDESCVRFVQNILKRGHEAVIEHYNITVRFICDRGVSHEIVRHRIASYCQESTRYCNYSNDKFGNEITVIDIRDGIELDPKMKHMGAETITAIYDEWIQACLDAETHYNKMIELGATPQIARSALLNSLKTELVMTANLREWRNVLRLRCSPAAHPQCREVMLILLQKLHDTVPVIFDDIYDLYKNE